MPSRVTTFGWVPPKRRVVAWKGLCTLSHLVKVRSPTSLELRGAMVTQEEGTWRAKHQVQMSPPSLPWTGSVEEQSSDRLA